MANYQTYSSLQNGLLSDKAFEQSNLEKEQAIELEEEVETLQLEIEATEEEIISLRTEIEIKEGEIATAESAKVESAAEATFEENKMTEELAEAAATEIEAEEASANAAEDLLEGEEAELGEAVLFWIPGLDVADEILAGVLFTEAATATALAIEKQTATSSLTSEAAVDREIMTTAHAEEDSQQGIIDEKNKEIVETRVKIAELEEEIEESELTSQDMVQESEALQVQATEQEIQGKEKLEESLKRLSKSFYYRVEGMLMEALCLLSITFVAIKGLVQQTLGLLWRDEKAEAERVRGDWKSSLYHSLYYGIALGLLWSFFTRDYPVSPSPSPSSTFLSSPPPPSSSSPSPIAHVASLSPHLFSHLHQALLAIGFGVLFSLLLALCFQIAVRSSLYQGSVSSHASLGVVSFVSWKYLTSIELLLVLLLTLREWSLYVPLLPGGWFALSQLCSSGPSSSALSSSSHLLFTCPPHNLSISTILSHTALFLSIFFGIFLFITALSYAIRSADRQPSALGYSTIKVDPLSESTLGEWNICGLKRDHLPALALHLLFTGIILLLYLPTLQRIHSELLTWQAQVTIVNVSSLGSAQRESLSTLIRSLLVTSLTATSKISAFVSVVHFAMSTLALDSALAANRTHILSHPLFLLHGFLMASVMFLQTFLFGVFLILLVVSSTSLSLAPSLPSPETNAPPAQLSSPSSIQVLGQWCYLFAVLLTLLSLAVTTTWPHLSLPSWHRQIIDKLKEGSQASPHTYQQNYDL
jgi:hypothetical protein